MKRLLVISLILTSLLQVIHCASYDVRKTDSLRKHVYESLRNKKILYIKTTDQTIDLGYVVKITYIYRSDFFIFKSGKLKKEIKIQPQDLEEAFIVDDYTLFKVTLLDNSILLGIVSDMNLENASVVFVAKHNKYNIPFSKIRDIRLFDPTYVKTVHVNIIFLDGSEMFGTMVKEDGENVILSTILGEQSYPRKEINRIEYLK